MIVLRSLLLKSPLSYSLLTISLHRFKATSLDFDDPKSKLKFDSSALSDWCILHRSKAEQVVETRDKKFHSSEMVKKVHLLYLVHDILKNNKWNGNEFVYQFWTVLPSTLKDVVKNGDDQGRKAVSRLVNKWEERQIFGSHVQRLKDVMLGEELPPPLEFGKKRSCFIHDGHDFLCIYL